MTEIEPIEEPQSIRAYPLLAWILLVGVMVFLFTWQGPSSKESDEEKQAIQRNMTEMQARYVVGAKQMTPGIGAQLAEQVTALDDGTAIQRVRIAIVLGELVGPDEALSWLEIISPDESPELVKTLIALYSAYEEKRFQVEPAPLTRQELVESLGWFGELALAPGEGGGAERARVLAPANRTAGVILAAAGIGVLLVLVGCGLTLVLIVMLSSGRWQSQFRSGVPHAGVYMETFTLWFVVFVAMMFVASLIPETGSSLFVFGCLSLATLLVLAWPVMRGIPWEQVRQDLGLSPGRGVRSEISVGVMTYLIALPLLALGILAMFLLMRFAPPGDPGEPGGVHPLLGMIRNDWWTRFQLYFVASFTAPVVEEIFFRGVFYRHLRELSRRTGAIVSVFFSGLVNSLLFAAIHPQGLVAIPVLMALALAFTMAREWRGSLIPCIVAHGISNGVVTTVLLVALSK